MIDLGDQSKSARHCWMSLCMKTKTQLIVFALVFVFATLFYLGLVSQSPAPSWENLVVETHKQIKNLKKLNEPDAFVEIQTNLVSLGFVDSPSVLNESSIKSITPTIAIPAVSGSLDELQGLLDTIEQWLPNFPLIVYDLGLSWYERGEIRQRCNKTRVCKLYEFDWSKYPSHVKVAKYKAYRPLIIQEVLNSSGAVVYLTPSHRVVSGDIGSALEVARQIGLVGWALDDSTSAITHPKMFSFFRASNDGQRVSANLFYFHRTISADHLIILNSDKIHKTLMLPWVQCTLTPNCLTPVGAQDTGCRSYRKPLYLYSGCHSYDLAAFNVALGCAFQFRAESYVVERRFFVTDKREISSTAATATAAVVTGLAKPTR